MVDVSMGEREWEDEGERWRKEGREEGGGVGWWRMKDTRIAD
jgi:hypothetical protein